MPLTESVTEPLSIFGGPDPSGDGEAPSGPSPSPPKGPS